MYTSICCKFVKENCSEKFKMRQYANFFRIKLWKIAFIAICATSSVIHFSKYFSQSSAKNLEINHNLSALTEYNAQNYNPYPNAIIIGVRKAGTYALLNYLSLHPDIVIAYNELMFFSHNYDKGLEYYLKQLPKRERPDQILIEKTPAYFRTRYAAERMYEMRQDLKIILIVREPVERMVSQYLHKDVRDRGSKQSFEVRKNFMSNFFSDLNSVEIVGMRAEKESEGMHEISLVKSLRTCNVLHNYNQLFLKLSQFNKVFMHFRE